MINFKSLCFVFSLTFSLPCFAVDTVKDLDLERYLGRWHQIAAIPQKFAKDCKRNTLAEYQSLPDNLIEVTNSCEDENGKPIIANGRARVNEEFQDNSRLEVTFVSLLGLWVWSFGGDYWVIDLDSEYQWAVVGHPELSGLYILSREPKLDPSILKTIRHKIEAQGYNSCDIIMSETPNGVYTGSEKFCEIEL